VSSSSPPHAATTTPSAHASAATLRYLVMGSLL
jgi:hypothetical protein